MKRFTVRQSSVPSAQWEVFDQVEMKHVEPRFSADNLDAANRLAATLNTNEALDRMADEERTMMELHLLRNGWTRMEQRGWWILSDEFGSFSGTLDWSYSKQIEWDGQEIEKIGEIQ